MEATKKIMEALIKSDPSIQAAFKDDKGQDSDEVKVTGDKDGAEGKESKEEPATSSKTETAVTPGNKQLVVSDSNATSTDNLDSKPSLQDSEDSSKKDADPLEIEVLEDTSKAHFERCYEKVIAELKADGNAIELGKEFKQLTTDEERVEFVRKLPIVEKVMKVAKIEGAKCYDAAITRRETGNGMFKKGYFADAHELYTQSVQLFPKELNNEQKTEFAKSFANRATTACHMNEYRACLTDIDRAFVLGYPDHLKYKIYEKQAKCYRHLKDYHNAVVSMKNSIRFLDKKDLPKEKKANILSDLKKQLSNCESLARDAASNPIVEEKVIIPEISKQRNEKLLNASSLIGLDYNVLIGRHGVAKQDVKVGDVVVVERPYSSVVLPPYYDTHCYYCYKRLKAPVACDHCTVVRFCQYECRDKAYREFHADECGLLQYIDSTDHCWGHLAYRIIINLGYTKLIEFMKQAREADEKKWSEFGTHGETINSEDYNCVYALVTHSDQRTESDLFYRAIKAAYLLKCLRASKFFPGKVSEEVMNFTGGLLLSHLQLCPCNAHEISELNVQTKDLSRTKTLEIGAGLYPTLSLLNHSCDPNVVRHFYGDVCVARAIHHIKKGEQIVDNYGALYPTQKLEERQKHLVSQYFFTCKCRPCREDWPLYNEMIEGEDAPPVLKCEKCGEALLPRKDVHSKEILDEYPCESCGRKHDIVQRMQALDHSHDRFASALDSVVKGDRQAVGALEDHLDLMDRLLHLPWKMFNSAQEALKHNYGVSANCFTLP